MQEGFLKCSHSQKNNPTVQKMPKRTSNLHRKLIVGFGGKERNEILCKSAMVKKNFFRRYLSPSSRERIRDFDFYHDLSIFTIMSFHFLLRPGNLSYKIR